MAFRMPQTPMSALGLPHSMPRAAAQAMHDRNEERRRRKRVVLIVVVLCTLVLLYELLQWAIGGSVAAAQRRATQRAVDDLRLKRQQGIEQAEQVRAVHQDSSADKGFRNDKQIVVLVTNFRDSDACARVLVEAHTLAFKRARVHYRIFDEVDLGIDETCVQLFCAALPAACDALVQSQQLQFATRDASSALGVTVAKHIVERMVSPQTFRDAFYLSIDPSVSLTTHWDLALLKQWYSIGNDMAILSVQPKALQLQRPRSEPATFLLQCSARIYSKAPDAVVAFNAPEPKPKANAALFAPVLQTQYSEMFHFGRVAALLAVRSDPHTPYVSVGHEYARATRFWTHGYDFYAPVDDVVYATYDWSPSAVAAAHSDGTEYVPPSSHAAASVRHARVARSNRRIRRLLQLPVSSTPAAEPLVDEALYALGTRRAMPQWQQFSRIDPAASYNESTTNQFVTCDERLQFVRYQF